MSQHRAEGRALIGPDTTRYTNTIRQALNTTIPIKVGHILFCLSVLALGYSAMALAQALWPEAVIAAWPAIWRVALALVVVTYAVVWGLDFLLRPLERAAELAPEWDQVSVTITADTSAFEESMRRAARYATAMPEDIKRFNDAVRRYKEHR